MKLSYKTLIAMNLARHDAEPGDVITLVLRNEDRDEGMFGQAQRLSDMFLKCYSFWPEEIRCHPDHLTLIRKVGKTLDITFNEEISKLLSTLVDLSDLPRRVPLVEDDSLDLFTAVARYHFRKEEAGDYGQHILEYLLDSMKKGD